MRKNPYLKDEQEFRPLLMRGSFGNNFLNTSLQMKQEIERLSSTTKETYTLNDISFDMVRSPSLNTKGIMFPTTNVEMCTTECTQGLFEEVMGFNYSNFKDKTDSATRPIENVSWFDCVAFCNELSIRLGYPPYYSLFGVTFGVHRTNAPKSIESAEVEIIGGNGFRLPTNEEWLAFAKAGTNNRWSGTNKVNKLWYHAWYKENANEETHPVATKKPNEWGMYDMSGNVSEWCWDKRNITGPNPSAFRTYRGGSLNSPTPEDLHLGNGFNLHPSLRGLSLGFRFARTIE